MKKQPKKLRILFSSNAPWSISGYGNQVAEILPRMQKLGYPIAMVDFYGLEGGKLMLDGVLHYPKMQHVYGSDAIVHHGRDFKADITFTLQDQWVLHPQDLQQVQRWIPIAPIDHEPVTDNVLTNLKMAYRIVTYSKFGQEELKKRGLHSTYIPHTVDTNIFKPMTIEERTRLRLAAGVPTDHFLFGMVAANKENPPRKSFQEVMDAFKRFLERNPKSLLYLHTDPKFPGGFDCEVYANKIGIIKNVLFPDPYQMLYNTDKEGMARIYNNLDCLLCPSVFEGFGVPIIEAQACGVPVIVNNYTSMPELVKHGETGFICDWSYKRFDPFYSYVAIPSVDSLFNCMIDVYKADRVKLGETARTFMVDEYDTEKVFNEMWVPYLQKLEDEVYPST